jgi:hypothetical protein
VVEKSVLQPSGAVGSRVECVVFTCVGYLADSAVSIADCVHRRLFV